MTRAARAWASGVAAALILATGSTALAAEPERAGDARITPDEGGSGTPFTVKLPGGASCPGDSADDGFRVNSYMVPVAVDPATVLYDGLGPKPAAYGDYATFREPLFDLETNSYVSIQTADAEEPGQPGTIVNIPDFNYAVYEPGDVPAGRYNVGIACTLLNEIHTIWNTEIVVTEASDDKPAQIHWRVAEGGGSGDGSSASAVPIAAAAVAIAAGVVLLRRRRQSRPIATSTEEP